MRPDISERHILKTAAAALTAAVAQRRDRGSGRISAQSAWCCLSSPLAGLSRMMTAGRACSAAAGAFSTNAPAGLLGASQDRFADTRLAIAHRDDR